MNKNTSLTASPITVPCFFVVHTAKDCDMDVYAFSTKMDARKSIADDMHAIEKDMKKQRTEFNSTTNVSGNACIYIPDTDFFHSWMIYEGTISCHGSLRDLAPAPGRSSSIMKECFIVTDFSRENGTVVYAFDTKEAANESISGAAAYMGDGLHMQGYQPAIRIEEGVKARVTIPDTNTHYEWKIIKSFICLQYKEPIEHHMPTKTSATQKKTFIVMRGKYKGPSTHFVFESEADAQIHVHRDFEALKESLALREYQPEYFIYSDGSIDLCVPSENIYYFWKIIRSDILPSSEVPSIPSPAPQSSTTEKMVTELCPHCGTEVTMQWDTAAMGFSAFCPHCGEALMLCDECRHAADSSVCDHNEEGFCHRCTPDCKVPSAMTTTTPLGSIIVRGGYGEGPGFFADLRRPDADQDMPLVYVGFSPKTESGQGCIEVLISGDGRKSQENERVVFDGVEDYFRTDDSDYIVLITPTLAATMISDLGNGQPSDNGERTSQYFTIAKGRYALDKTVKVCLIENKEGLPEDSQYYSLHMIDDVAGGPCKWFNSDLNEDALEQLLKEILDGLEGVNYAP